MRKQQMAVSYFVAHFFLFQVIFDGLVLFPLFFRGIVPISVYVVSSATTPFHLNIIDLKLYYITKI